MIVGAHVISTIQRADRAFLQDIQGFSSVDAWPRLTDLRVAPQQR
jgi:hypothetical protein